MSTQPFALLSASDLQSRRLQQIVDEYINRSSQSEEKRLRAALDKCIDDESEDGRRENAKGYLAFINGPGQNIWDEFVTELAQSKYKRDFAPFTADEEKRVTDTLKLLLSATSTNPASNEAANAQRRRFALGISFFSIGTVILMLTFWGIPSLTEWIFDLKMTGVIGQFDQARAEVARLVESEHFQTVTRSAREITTRTSTISADVARIEGEQLETYRFAQEAVDRCTRLQEACDKLSDPTALLIGPLEQVNTSLESMRAPDELTTATDDLAKQIGEIDIEGNDSAQVRAAAARLVSTYAEDVRGTVLANPRTIQSRDELRSSIISLREAVEQTRANLLATLPSGDAVGSETGKKTLAEALTAVQDPLEKMGNSNSLNVLSDRLRSLQAALPSMSQQGDEARDLFTDAEAAVRQVELAAQQARGAVDAIDTLAYRGAGPSIMVLLAIGAMFITFSITSILAWVKSHERQRDSIEADRRTERMVQVATTLLARGVDPTRVLTLVDQIAVRTDGAQPRTMPTPLSQTLAELIGAIKGKD